MVEAGLWRLSSCTVVRHTLKLALLLTTQQVLSSFPTLAKSCPGLLE